MGHDEDGRLVLLSQEPDQEPMEAALDILSERLGTDLSSRRGELAHALQGVFDRAGDKAGATVLAEVLARLPTNKWGTAMRAALLSGVDSYDRDKARRIGMSPAAFSRTLKRLRNRIFPK